ncbi:MAG: very short patch repair endonuclease [Desulfovibrio sp.]|uniref:very short patch repair endonuclease n=1 Tax=Desulfovibrio sp. TaxID=885 RepID=UPI00258EC19D|nr:very short patch repair endonuclease [Desulfovibrio sp.]MCD7984881.1 very short patch repair endonuclease [Desulfovibrio sp.]
MDTANPEKRSWIMRQVKGRDTSPEKIVRSLLHRMGYRFRLQRDDLPGKPDIVLPRFKTVVFVNGGFWHRHSVSKRATTHETTVYYSQTKFARNVARDARNQVELEKMGWRVVIVWECELKDKTTLEKRLNDYLKSSYV